MENVPFCVKQNQIAQDSVKDQAEFAHLADFPARLRLARKEKKLNQTDFAAVGGVSLNSQGKYEAGLTEPSVSYLMNLATVGIDVHWLLTGQRSAGVLDQDLSVVVDAVAPLSRDQRNAILTVIEAFSE